MDNKQPVSVITRGFGGLTFDAVFQEDHTSELEVTDNPVETGVSVTDHAYMKPLSVKISAGVTNTPMRSLPGDPYGLVGDNRAQKAFELLQLLQAKAEPIDAVTGLRIYRNMIVKSITTSQNKDTANSLVFTAELREVIIANTQVVTYPPRKAGSAHEQGSKTKENGEKQGQEPGPPKRKSIAKSLVKLMGIGG